MKYIASKTQLHMLHNTLTDLVSAIHNQNTANTNASNAASNENNASSASNVRVSNTSTNVMNTSNNTSTSNVPEVPSVLVQPIQRSSSSQSLNRIQYVHENERRPTPFNPRRVYDPERNVLLTQEDVAAFGSVNSNNITEAETRCFLSRLERHLSNDPHDTEFLREAHALRQLSMYMPWQRLAKWLQIYARPDEDLLYPRIQYWRKKYEDHQERCFMPPREQPSLATSLQRLVELMATRQQSGNQRNDTNTRNVSRFPYTNANRPSFRSNNNNNNNTFSFRRNNDDRNTIITVMIIVRIAMISIINEIMIHNVIQTTITIIITIVMLYAIDILKDT